jgi:hypothetical protein
MNKTANAQANEYTQTDLLNNGWTKTTIDRFLPQPRMETRRSRIHGNYTVLYWTQEVVQAAKLKPEVRAHFEKLARRRSATDCEPRELSLSDAVYVAANTAKGLGDRANDGWGSGNRPLAVKCRLNEIDFLGLKERGMIALHKERKLRYVGATPEGMAVYENPENEKQYLHSRLHPESAKQLPVVGHPEVLLMPSKAQNNRGHQAKHVLRSLPAHAIGYIRSNLPAHIRERESSTCWLCGELGHPASDCWTFRVYRSGDWPIGDGHSRRFTGNMLSTG